MTKEEWQKLMRCANAGTMPDALNPIFLFSTTDSRLLKEVAAGKLDVIEIAKRELEARMIKY